MYYPPEHDTDPEYDDISVNAYQSFKSEGMIDDALKGWEKEKEQFLSETKTCKEGHSCFAYMRVIIFFRFYEQIFLILRTQDLFLN